MTWAMWIKVGGGGIWYWLGKFCDLAGPSRTRPQKLPNQTNTQKKRKKQQKARKTQTQPATQTHEPTSTSQKPSFDLDRGTCPYRDNFCGQNEPVTSTQKMVINTRTKKIIKSIKTPKLASKTRYTHPPNIPVRPLQNWRGGHVPIGIISAAKTHLSK